MAQQNLNDELHEILKKCYKVKTKGSHQIFADDDPFINFINNRIVITTKTNKSRTNNKNQSFSFTLHDKTVNPIDEIIFLIKNQKANVIKNKNKYKVIPFYDQRNILGFICKPRGNDNCEYFIANTYEILYINNQLDIHYTFIDYKEFSTDNTILEINNKLKNGIMDEKVFYDTLTRLSIFPFTQFIFKYNDDIILRSDKLNIASYNNVLKIINIIVKKIIEKKFYEHNVSIENINTNISEQNDIETEIVFKNTISLNTIDNFRKIINKNYFTVLCNLGNANSIILMGHCINPNTINQNYSFLCDVLEKLCISIKK
jgi:hypothetical protein